jgi:hypothetical protein
MKIVTGCAGQFDMVVRHRAQRDAEPDELRQGQVQHPIGLHN